MNGAAVSWKSKLQSIVADSTGYAETIAAHEALKEVKCLKLFLEEMKVRVDPIQMFLDASNTVSNLLHCKVSGLDLFPASRQEKMPFAFMGYS